MLVFGLAMVLIMVWRPRGLISTRKPSVFLKQAQAIGADRSWSPRGGPDERDEPWDRSDPLTVEHLTMRFGGLVAVDDLSFDVGRGEITALIGPNGAGKTTVFNCITGFYKPTEGRIALRRPRRRSRLDERPRSSTPREGTASSCWSACPTSRSPRPRRPHLPEHPPVRRHDRAGEPARRPAQHPLMRLASAFRSAASLGLPPLSAGRAEAIEKARYWLEKVGLIDRADDPAADLPYGAQRRLEIARAMCTDPLLLCLDEPAAGLNPRESAELNELLQFIRDEHGPPCC
jgi:branched-chain amino acid transport system ATP-binding protein